MIFWYSVPACSSNSRSVYSPASPMVRMVHMGAGCKCLRATRTSQRNCMKAPITWGDDEELITWGAQPALILIIYIYIWSHGVERNRQHIQAAQNCYTDNTTSSQPCNKIKETTSHMLQSLRLHIYDNTYNKTYTQLQKNNSRKVPADIESLRRKYHQYLTRKTHKKIPKADPGSKTFQHNLDIPRAYSFSLSQ